MNDYLNLKLSYANWDILQNSDKCACVYCLKEFHPNQIINWAKEHDGKETAICPHCGVDSVIAYNSYPYTADDLIKWHKILF